MNKEIVKLTRKIYNTLLEFDENFSAWTQIDVTVLKAMSEIDCIWLAIYLEMADGNISDSEVEFMNALFEYEFAVEDWVYLMDTYDDKVDKPVIPKKFPLVVETDNLLYKKGNGNSNSCEFYIYIYRLLGEAIIKNDARINHRKVAALSAYLENMQRFYENNTIRK